MLKKILGLLMLLCVVPLTTLAADSDTPLMDAINPAQDAEAETAHWHWPELGISFDYPASWILTGSQNFNFVLAVPPSEGPSATSFVGLQSARIPEGETMASFFEGFSAEIGAEYEPTTFGGVDSFVLSLPNDSGREGRLYGYMASADTFALLTIAGETSTWDDFWEDASIVLDTVEISFLELDEATLTDQMAASVTDNERLIFGSEDAPLRLIEVFDFACPACVNYTRSVERLIHDYVETGLLQLEVIPVSFVGRDFSFLANEALYCGAAQGQGWASYKTLYDLSERGGAQAFTLENINTSLSALDGFDAEAFASCIGNGTYRGAVQVADNRATELNVTGTPAILIADPTEDGGVSFIIGEDGEPVRGAISLYFLYPYLDDALSTLEAEAGE